jgi:hypothetical protein
LNFLILQNFKIIPKIKAHDSSAVTVSANITIAFFNFNDFGEDFGSSYIALALGSVPGLTVSGCLEQN